MVKVKHFFIRVGLWFKNHAPTKRRLIQIYAALLYNANIRGFVTGSIYQGATKNACVPGLNCYSCPGAVGACPLGALQDSLAHSDTTAPFYILGILGLFGLICARTICGFLCPVGLGQELLYKIKTPKLKKSRYTRLLSYLKYILLVVMVIAIPLLYHGIPAFCKYICPAGTFGGAGGLLSNPNNGNLGNSGEDLFDQLGYLFTWKFALLIGFIVASIFIYRFFCRFFCPLGAIYGFFNKIALIGVKLDDKKCVDCGMCIQTCKMDIRHVGDHECINCGECIPVCPTKAISWKGSRLVLAGIDTSVIDEKPLKPMAVTAVNSSVGASINSSEAQPSEGGADVTPSPDGREERVKAVESKIKKRSFWLQFAAWAVALTVLLTALICYNFVGVKADGKNDVYKVGDTAPDFTFGTVYDTAGARLEDGSLTENIKLSDFGGKAVVLNFWYTTCDPCKAELPDFYEAQKTYGDDVAIIVVHVINSVDDAGVQAEIDRQGWNDWELIFTHDTEEAKIFNSLGGKSTCPRTVIMDSDRKITFTYTGKIANDRLNEEIVKAIGK